jgi:hypothetical protein
MAQDDLGTLAEHYRDLRDEVEAREAEEKRKKEKKETPEEKRQRMVEEMKQKVKQALELRADPRDAWAHDKKENIELRIGMMVRAEQLGDSHDDDSEHEPPMAIVVLENGTALGGSKVKIPLEEVGVDQVLFVSKGSRLGAELLGNEESLKQAIVEKGIGELTFMAESGRFNSSSNIKVTWSVTALYEPEQTKGIILKHLEEVAV